MRSLRTPLFVAIGLLCNLRAEPPILIFEVLKQPLKLPSGLVEVLPLNHKASFYGDSLRAVDCTDEKELPFGTCGNLLFGGLAMTSSHLSGSIRIQFYPPVQQLTQETTGTYAIHQVSHFDVSHGALQGDDSVLASPQGFEMPVLFNQVIDAPYVLSQGDLDLNTGGVANLQYRVNFVNSALVSLGNVNPKLVRPVIAFPGARGHAWATFEQRPDGLLDFTFEGHTFLPLGHDVEGDPVRFPLQFCGPGFHCASVLARGTSLHPHLMISTKEPEGPPCDPNCPDIPFNTIQEFTVNTYHSWFGDDFTLDIPQLGGRGPGRSHLQGRLQIQFGPKTGDTVPFVVTTLVPEALLATPPENAILGHGPLPGLLGQEEFLRFPLLSYHLRKVVIVDEPYNFNHGMIDLSTGKVIGEMVYPFFFGQSLAEVLFDQNDGRISKDPFFIVARHLDRPEDRALYVDLDPATRTYALFEKGPNEETVFRFSGDHRRTFATYRFPSPDFIKANSFIGGNGAELHLFTRLQAMHSTDTPKALKTGGANSVTSSIGDTFSYSYSISCDPAGAAGSSFQYTNNNPGDSGGTFTMKRLAAVSCTNSLGSHLASGDSDTITFMAFGTWSKDAADADPRAASVQISTAPDAPYFGIIVFQKPDASSNVVLSNANTRPTDKTLP